MKLLNLWYSPDPLGADESLLESWLACRSTSRFHFVGGKLELTTHRLVFRPSRIERLLLGKIWRLLCGKIWRAPLNEITVVERSPRNWNLLNGGAHDRLRVTTRDGSSNLFLVDHLEHVMATIVAAQARASATGLVA